MSQLGAGSGETLSLAERFVEVDISQILEPAQAFVRSPGPHAALDLLSTIHMLGVESPLESDAEAVLGADRQRASDLGFLSDQGPPTTGVLTLASQDLPRESIRKLRARLIKDPRDALAWIDMSLMYTNLGQQVPARKAMDIALQLEPHHRLVLRAASRLFIHQDAADIAFQILDRSGVQRHDPWIAASHLAAAEVVGISPRNIRESREMLVNNDMSPRSVAELASQLGTIELKAGRQKRGKLLVRQSFREPNDNVLAQAAWAANLGAELPEASLVDSTPMTYEATARMRAREQDWAGVLESARSWYFDQPFSTLAATFAGWASGVFGEGFETASHLIDLSLLANPADVMLLNNSAFVNIHLGRLDLARKALDRAAHADQPIHLGTLSATAGLLAYRLGDVDTGRALYEESLRIFRASGYSDSAELASLYWMLEQIRLPLTESQRANIRSQAQRRVSLRGTDFQYLAERVLKGL